MFYLREFDGLFWIWWWACSRGRGKARSLGDRTPMLRLIGTVTEEKMTADNVEPIMYVCGWMLALIAGSQSEGGAGF